MQYIVINMTFFVCEKFHDDWSSIGGACESDNNTMKNNKNNVHGAWDPFPCLKILVDSRPIHECQLLLS